MKRPATIPDCYEADKQYDCMDRVHTARIMRRPSCECCGEHIQSESYIDLSPFGLDGVACERCIDRNTHPTEDLDDAYA